MSAESHLKWQRAHRALDDVLDLLDAIALEEEAIELPFDQQAATRAFVLSLAHEIVKEYENATR
jgi:7,8-dihydro-6-hydroxymethylpterin-pyrophosphokinase